MSSRLPIGVAQRYKVPDMGRILSEQRVVIVNDLLKAGDVRTYRVRVEYNDDATTTPSSNEEYKFEIGITYEQSNDDGDSNGNTSGGVADIVDKSKTTPDGKFSIEETRCVGACGLAPVFTVNGEVYGGATVQKLDQVIDEIKAKEENK